MSRRLGELEDVVMSRLWQWNRPTTVREVLEDLRAEREIAYTTVMTVMDKLHQKGWLRRDQQGRAYLYQPVSSREAYTATLMYDAWNTSENRAAALVHFFSMMKPDELAALRAAVRVVSPETEVREPDTGQPDPRTPEPEAGEHRSAEATSSDPSPGAGDAGDEDVPGGEAGG